MATGVVTGFQGPYLCGWAYEGPAGANCTIEVRDADGRAIKRGRAARYLEGKGNIGFRIPIGYPQRQKSEIRVFADNIELIGSPLCVGAGVYDGAMWVESGIVQGWVTERCSNGRPPHVDVSDQCGNLLASIQASVDRTENDDPLFTPAKFSFVLPHSCIGWNQLALTASVDGKELARTICSFGVDGFLDALTAAGCAGWLFCPSAPDHRLVIEAYVDGRVCGLATCNMLRSDLQARYPGVKQATLSGFSVQFDPPPRSGIFSVSLRLQGSSRELFGGPHLIGDRDKIIRSLQRIASLALSPASLPCAIERSLLQEAVQNFIQTVREGPAARPITGAAPGLKRSTQRLTIVIPIYRGVDVTQRCIESVLRVRRPDRDRVILVNDQSPDGPEMEGMLASFGQEPNLLHLTNGSNLGFVKSVNRALGLCGSGDVVLLNSDTLVYPGAFDELHAIAARSPEIGTVTALSNQATIFSYPHPDLATKELMDISWEALASVALERNRGLAVEVPTGHGFCMLVKREVLDRVGGLDETYGRGYGEENELCLRAADLGFRHVAAAGVFVQHCESVSFGTETTSLKALNSEILTSRFPEYDRLIADWIKNDDLRSARWALDAVRLKTAARNRDVMLVVKSHLPGGVARAESDIEANVGLRSRLKLELVCCENGYIELKSEDPTLRSVFAPSDIEAMFRFLEDVPNLQLVLIHQLLGFPDRFVKGAAEFVKSRTTIFFAHDFYPICPRATLIDAQGEFCRVPVTAVCGRCVAIAGVHPASKMEASAEEHRAVFGRLLQNCRHVIAPSTSAAANLRLGFTDIVVRVVPHPEFRTPKAGRRGCSKPGEIILLGAIGPHKGSAKLLELAMRSRLHAPDLHFTVIGYTDIDDDLSKIGNVTITGAYEADELPKLIKKAGGQVALFLQGCPETYSYTLSEAIQAGLFPVVADIGAPGDRVREHGYGLIYPYPIDTKALLKMLQGIATGAVKAKWRDDWPAKIEATSVHSVETLRSYMMVGDRKRRSTKKTCLDLIT